VRAASTTRRFHASAGSLHFEHQVLDPQAGQHEIGVLDLVVDVANRPIENGCEEVFEDVFGHLLGGNTMALLLLEAFRAVREEP